MTESKSWDHLYIGQEKRFEEPLILEAEVTTGFKRGSTELGFPTANLSMETLGEKGSNLGTGIYYGIAHLYDKEYQTVISVGLKIIYYLMMKSLQLLQP
jgi:riboflavin kinase